MTEPVPQSIVSAEELRVRAGGRSWNAAQTADAARILAEAEGEISALLGGAPISPGPARVEDAPILVDGLVCPRWPVHTVTSIDGTVVDETHPLPEGWLLEDGYLTRTAAVPLVGVLGAIGIETLQWSEHAYAAGTIRLGYQPGWGDVPAIRSMLMRIALARVLNMHDDTMIARDLQAEAPPPVREPDPDEIRTRLSRWRWLQVHR